MSAISSSIRLAVCGLLVVSLAGPGCSDGDRHEPPNPTSDASCAAPTADVATIDVVVPSDTPPPPRDVGDDAGTPRGTDPTSPRFTLAVLPDTQYLFDEDRGDAEPVSAALRFLLAPDAFGREDRNVLFLAQLGDVTEHGTADEMALADVPFRLLDGQLPYSVLAGNHDIPSGTNDTRGASPFLTVFGPERFRGDPTFGGASPDGYNRYHVFTGGGREWLVLALDWRLSPAGVTWAQGVINAHPRTPVILTTHELAGADANTGVAALSAYGQQLWDNLIRRNDQIFLTLNGHFWPPGRTVLRNDAGHDVHVHITNYQDRYYGGSGMVRLYTFDLARRRIDVETFSPWVLSRASAARTALERGELELADETNRFSLALDFDQRFAGFAPPPQPPARPAAALVIPGTVAYWRFDASATSGASVPTGAVVADLSGQGNDVTVARIGASTDAALMWSADHHPDQPSDYSLAFDGGRSPARGAYLRTADTAPINRMQFEAGYTIEAFIKIPAGFTAGGHNWMGVLSWMGRSGDAGHIGGDVEEPVSSLNVSPERFLQWIAYPVPRTDASTHWSHAVPTGTWMHVAIVNDGTRSVMYVQGSPIARNPRAAARGIATHGTPFAIGGTQYANAFEQSFYGSIGDVRVVNRPLAVGEFMSRRTTAGAP